MAKGTLAIARPQSCIFRLDFSKKIQLLTDLLSCKMTEAQIFVNQRFISPMFL